MNGNGIPEIQIKGAKENNLKNISLAIPHNQLIVVTGISGSGKSSLIYDTLAKEGQRRYFETLTSFSRQFSGKLNRPNVEAIEGLSPVITIGQHSSNAQERSTVGTISELYDLLRLLFARVGKTERNIKLSRSLFSFNSDHGKCKCCRGIGRIEQIDLKKLIKNPQKTIREGALAPTLPTGYIMYSQVTIDVLNQVCEAEGFNVDIVWDHLSNAQKNIVLYGSEKIKVPFGKHSIESRLKWTGIKAKPREEGFYKGMIPIMSDILKRDRNANILKYVQAVECQECSGARLNSDALSVKVYDKRIIDLTEIELTELASWIQENRWDEIGTSIIDKIWAHIELLKDLGIGHLNLNRRANSLSASEIQRIRIANQILVPISNVTYVFDEPSIGLHPLENRKMIHHFKELVKRGNTVIVVEHNLETILNAEHIIDIGPKAGDLGGELLFNGALTSFLQNKNMKKLSPTYQALHHPIVFNDEKASLHNGYLILNSCSKNNLKSIDVHFQLGGLNIVSGPSGSGKSSLVKSILLNVVREHLGMEINESPKLSSYENVESIDKLIYIDHSPIGRTPRSNPATYLGISDFIRDAFAKLEKAKSLGFTKSSFSFNNKGGRCEACQGAGKTQIGMHYLGNIDIQCSSCNGKRFNDAVLQIKLNELSIADVYQLTVSEAVIFFDGFKKVLKGLKTLEEIGLGYISLGQSSTTLSGGEAQRIKIANQLQKSDSGNTLFVIVEPTIGLHNSNILSLLQMFEKIKSKGNTIVCIEQNEVIIQSSDWHVELGPKNGWQGGQLMHQGAPEMRDRLLVETEKNTTRRNNNEWISLNGVTTNGLKNINVQFPKNRLTVVTGLSGSGKSSLVYDTLFSEANTRFTESLSVHNRSFIAQNNQAELESSSGLGPAIGLNRKKGTYSQRSTVGTITGVYQSLRLLYSRLAQEDGQTFTAQNFSFNHHSGACENCKGHGNILQCSIDQLVVDDSVSIFDGALSVSKGVKYFTNLDGQFVAVLKEIGLQKNWDLSVSWKSLSDEMKNVILFGTGEKEWEIDWEFKTKSRSGVQKLKQPWLGFCNYINEEFERRKNNKNTTELVAMLHEVECNECCGSRLKPELLEIKFQGMNIHEFSLLTIKESQKFLSNIGAIANDRIKAIINKIVLGIQSVLETLLELGLGYLNMNRSIKSLSGGEQQRVALAGQLSNHLYGVTYVLDEPTIGLDEKQILSLTKILKRLTSKGNTVIVIEHDKSFINESDYLIEIGPFSGFKGGLVMYQGELDGVRARPELVTHNLLFDTAGEIRQSNHKAGNIFGVKNAFANNLKGIDVAFESKAITAVTGISGSGKSSLIRDVLYTSWKSKKAISCDEVYGLEQFENVVYIDQNALLTSVSMTPASYLGIIDHLKTLFGSQDEVKELGIKKADFSYQSKNGKCSVCKGNGKLKTSMDFMSDLWLECYLCQGKRFSQPILQVKINGKSIGDVMEMTANELHGFFDHQKLNNDLSFMANLGIGHVMIGQSSDTLSGGEVQRLKLCKKLLVKRTGSSLFIFDEPSTGLHRLDIEKVIFVFNNMIDKGHTIIFIEHNETMIQCAHKIIEIGPGSGESGGRILN